MRDEYREIFGKYFGPKMLNVGCANNKEDGFINIDSNSEVSPDVLHDLEYPPLPFGESSIDLILGSHVFEHIRNIFQMVEDFHYVLKPGGHLIAITPYGSADSSWENPHHVRGFSEMTWHYFDQDTYGKSDAGNGAAQGYAGNFKVVETHLVPYPEFLNDPEIEFKKRHWRNVIKELQVVLKAVK